MVSMDNCARNGEKLRAGVLSMARDWAERGLVESAFLDWLEDEGRVSFPWSMIDKITPHPPSGCRRSWGAWVWRTWPLPAPTRAPLSPLCQRGDHGVPGAGGRFPQRTPRPGRGGGVSHGPDHRGEGGKDEGGHLPQPLHTALAVYGCLLGYTSIAAEMGMQISRPWWSILPPRVCPWWKIPVSSAPGHSLTRCSMSDSPIPPSRIHRSVSQPTPHRSCPSVTAAPSGAMHGSRSRHWPDWSSPPGVRRLVPLPAGGG